MITKNSYSCVPTKNKESTVHNVSHVVPFELGYQSIVNTDYIDSYGHVCPTDVSEEQIQCDIPNHSPCIQTSHVFHAGAHDE